MQLVAYGAQDIYLTGNPQITFFKVVYRRHTNFAMESIEQTFNGTVGNGNRVTCTVSRNGDLVHRMWVEATVDVATNPGTNVGHMLLNEVELEIGGQRVDKHYADWLQVWSELTVTSAHQNGYNTMVGSSVAASTGNKLYVPLQFWFCRNPGLALPLIALQYHEVKVNVTFGAQVKNTADQTSTVTLQSASLWVDYVYLDTDERRRFAQVSHEYLIEQVQFTGDESISSNNPKIRLNFNHPVKELIWTVGLTANVTGNYTDNAVMATGVRPVSNAKLQLNGHDRFAQRNGDYFNLVQPYQHHTRTPSSLGISVYSFALKPEEHQPSGTCNFSRIDNATLNLTVTDNAAAGSVVKVFAVNYNVLRVMSGMGGLAYSN